MDILAAMLAYLVCVTGIVTGLAISFVVFFSAPGQFSSPPTQAIAMVARPSRGDAARVSPAETIANIDHADEQIAAAAAKAKAVPPLTIVVDTRQKPPFSHGRARRLAERVRAKHLASRERSSFETRFLHFDD